MRVLLIISCLLIVLSFDLKPKIFDSTPFDKFLVKVAAAYSAITHCTKQQTESFDCKICNGTEWLVDVTRIENTLTDILGYVGYNTYRKLIFVVWRKTVDNRNVIEDLDFAKTEYLKCKGCQVHQGFTIAWKSVEKKVHEEIDKLFKKYPDANIFVTGHSLGGALATLSALDLQLKYNKVTGLYTFGGPRVGNENFAQFLKSKIQNIYRIVHDHDYAPHVPFQYLEYHHASTQVDYNADFSSYTVCDSTTGQDPKCSNKYYPKYSFPDHDVYFYPMDNTGC